jgi:hypothetical protein
MSKIREKPMLCRKSCYKELLSVKHLSFDNPQKHALQKIMLLGEIQG